MSKEALEATRYYFDRAAKVLDLPADAPLRTELEAIKNPVTHSMPNGVFL